MQHDHSTTSTPSHVIDPAVAGQHVHVNSTGGSHKDGAGTRGDDVFHARTSGHPADQVHLFGGDGDDDFHLYLGHEPSRHIMHGHHVFGGAGANDIHFEELEALRGTIVGRLDDFRPDADRIFIAGQLLDLSRPQAIRGFGVAVVRHQGQQWLEMRNDHGGRALYALEGARLDRFEDGRWIEEPHFLSWDHPLPPVLPRVAYRDPGNFLPRDTLRDLPGRHEITSHDGGTRVVHIHGTDGNDAITTDRAPDMIHAGAGDDDIRTSFGNDTILGGAGDDLIESGKGHDLIDGGTGNDTIAGGSDRDTIDGGAGDDLIFGGTENDLLRGGSGDDRLHGGHGNDRLLSGGGRDSLWGGLGADTLTAEGEVSWLFGDEGRDVLFLGGDRVTAAGGSGSDVFVGRAGTEARITDFDAEADRLRIGGFFRDADHLAEHVTLAGDAQGESDRDLVIALPDGGSITLAGGERLASELADMVEEWSPLPHATADETAAVLPDEEPADMAGGDGGGAGFGMLGALVGVMLMLAGGGFGGL